MSKVLLIGYVPPQLAGEAKIEAAHYRTWQFLEPLLSDGHVVCLAADGPEEVQTAMPAEWRTGLTYAPVPFGRRGWVPALQDVHDRFQPDCVVAVNFSHCLYATRLRTQAPVWMDIYGEMLTIMQAAFYRAQSDRGLATSLAFMRQVLRKGDVFSGCGTPQKHALVGELAMAGRLNRHTFGYEFVHVVLPGAQMRPVQRKAGQRPFLAVHGVTPEDFVVLWCGGYNTWTDVDTLFAGLEDAMSRNPRVHYLSVGANTYDGPDNVYARLQEQIAASPYRDRFHMLGWRPWHEIADFYRESDVGLNIDALHYETIYGTRTRLVEMIGAGLPVITTLGSELSYLLQEERAALTFNIGDAKALADQVVTLATNADLCQEIGENARRYVKETLSFCATTAPVRRWVADPTAAPDKRGKTVRDRLEEGAHRLRSLARLFLWRVAGYDK